ncbi:hypothetical protein MXD58_012430, partial [Frankia sp. AgKG'84/4]|nr:hypothetical protein [Frankia sp. AgKG'84/4]
FGPGPGAAGMTPPGSGGAATGAAGPGASAQVAAGGYPGSAPMAAGGNPGFGRDPEPPRPAQAGTCSGASDSGGEHVNGSYAPAGGDARPASGQPAGLVHEGTRGGTTVTAETAMRAPVAPGRPDIPGQVAGYGQGDGAGRPDGRAAGPGQGSDVGAWNEADRDGPGHAQQTGPRAANGHGAGWEVAGQRAQQQRGAGQGHASSGDEPSLDDDDAPQQAGGARGGEEAAMSLLRTGLGATVIEQIPTT